MKLRRPRGRDRNAHGETRERKPGHWRSVDGRSLRAGKLPAGITRVKANKGSPGVDGMTVHELPGYLKQHWPAIREQLLSGTYKPQPVKRSGNRQAGRRGAQVGHSHRAGSVYPAGGDAGSAKRWDRTFSEHSYGFRPGRSAHQAVEAAQQYIAAGYRWWWTWTWRNFSTGSITTD